MKIDKDLSERVARLPDYGYWAVTSYMQPWRTWVRLYRWLLRLRFQKMSADGASSLAIFKKSVVKMVALGRFVRWSGMDLEAMIEIAEGTRCCLDDQDSEPAK